MYGVLGGGHHRSLMCIPFDHLFAKDVKLVLLFGVRVEGGLGGLGTLACYVLVLYFTLIALCRCILRIGCIVCASTRQRLIFHLIRASCHGFFFGVDWKWVRVGNLGLGKAGSEGRPCDFVSKQKINLQV